MGSTEIGTRITKRREKLGLTIHAFERKHGFSARRIARIEEGGTFTAEMAVKLSDALEMPLDRLLKGTGPSAL